MASPHPREDLPFSPADLVLRYSLEQRADYLGDVFAFTVQHWQIEVVAEQFDGAGDDPVSWPVGWARVTIATRDQGANLYEVFDAIDGITRQLPRPCSIRATVISQRTWRNVTR